MMKIKTYKSDSVSRALAQINKELGPGAIILNTKRSVTKRFLGLVPTLSYEITAAADRAAPALENRGKSPPLESASKRRKIRSYEVDEVAGQKVTEPSHRPRKNTSEPRRAPSENSWKDQFEQLSSEVTELRSLLQGPTRPISTALQHQILSKPFQKLLWHDAGDEFYDAERSALISAEFQKLVNAGLDENVALFLNRGASRELDPGPDVGEQLRIRLNRALAEMIQVAPSNEDQCTKGGVMVFLGPTGVGKTTTIAKLAARFALNEQKKVRLLTLDTYRVAAAEQLKIYGEIIGVPVRVVYSVDELDEVVSNRHPEDYILVDTTGLSHKKVSEYSQLADYLSRNEEIRKQLVLSTTTNIRDLQEAVDSFSVFAPDGLVFTKLDESSSCGVIINELIRTKKPLSYLTNGQNVPDDLIIPSSETVANMVVPVN
jgi:flagellar biosynthesis protein FlhF